MSEDASFLGILDILSKQLFATDEEPIAFGSDCHEGICGVCGMAINGVPHELHEDHTTTCQLRMRTFEGGDTVTTEPWRSKVSPILHDLMVNREAHGRTIQTGRYISVNIGTIPEIRSVPVLRDSADMAFETAVCIGHGACAVACPNGSATLFTSVKMMRLGSLSQGKPENHDRIVDMLNRHGTEGFGACQNIGECARICPKQTPLDCIGYLSHQLGEAFFKGK